jgi:two-component system response regulator GlrR
VISFSPDALQKLRLYDWPGNVRELEHMIERAVVLCEQVIIQGADIDLPDLEVIVSEESFQEAKERMITEFERTYIQRLLLTYEGNVTKAAHAAHKDQRTFWRLIRKYRLNV